MSEMKGAMYSILIIIVFMFPIIFNASIAGIQNYTFLKVVSEFSGVVKEEGGETEKVKGLKNRLEDGGYSITYEAISSEGASISVGDVGFGDRLVIDFEYDYGVMRHASDSEPKDKETLKTQNTVTISRR